MSEKMMKKSRVLLAALFGMVAVAALTIWGCGTDSYNSGPTVPQTPNALVSASWLHDRSEEGLVNNNAGKEKVVILSISSSKDSYDQGHIPGAIYVDASEIIQTRIEGPAASSTMVADGTKMDALIQRCGIDQYTTIVFTAPASDAVYYPTRGYVTFRYWGFPKNKLKVLDGWDNGWKLANYSLTSVAPTNVKPSSYKVTTNNVSRVNTALRASLGEMMTTVANLDPATQLIIDTRPAGAFNGAAGATAGVFGATGDYTVFEGHMKGAVNIPYNQVGGMLNADNTYNVANLPVVFAAANGKTSYVYCRTGYIASSEFFALDGILGYNVVWYDGSWSQWGQMSSDVNNGGKLPLASVWATDSATYSAPTPILYNVGRTPAGATVPLDKAKIEVLPVMGGTFDTIADPAANQIENEDKAYTSPKLSNDGLPASSGGGC